MWVWVHECSSQIFYTFSFVNVSDINLGNRPKMLVFFVKFYRNHRSYIPHNYTIVPRNAEVALISDNILQKSCL